MFPKYRGGPGAGRELVLLALAVLVGAGLLLATGDRPESGTTRLEVTQATVAALPFAGEAPADADDDPAVAPTLPATGGAGAPARVPPTLPWGLATPAAETAQGGQPAPAPGPAGGALGTAAGAPGSNPAPAPDAAGGTPTASISQPAGSPITGATAGEPAVSILADSAGDSPNSTATPTSTPAPVTRSAEVATTTTTTATTAPPRTGPTRTPSTEAEIVPLTNRDRAGEGLGSLTRNGCLDSVASRYAEQMARSGVLAHNPGAGPAVIGCQPGATWGDNVGTSAPCDAALLEREWMASPSHRKNILTAAFRQIGVGAWTDEQGGCWVQVLFSS